MEPSRQRIKIHPLSFDLIIPSDTLLMGCKIEKRKGSLKREVDEFGRGFGICDQVLARLKIVLNHVKSKDFLKIKISFF